MGYIFSISMTWNRNSQKFVVSEKESGKVDIGEAEKLWSAECKQSKQFVRNIEYLLKYYYGITVIHATVTHYGIGSPTNVPLPCYSSPESITVISLCIFSWVRVRDAQNAVTTRKTRRIPCRRTKVTNKNAWSQRAKRRERRPLHDRADISASSLVRYEWQQWLLRIATQSSYSKSHVRSGANG